MVETEPWTYGIETSWGKYLMECYTSWLGYAGGTIAAICIGTGLKATDADSRGLCFTLALAAVLSPLVYAKIHWDRAYSRGKETFSFRFDPTGLEHEDDGGVRVFYPYSQIDSFALDGDWLRITPRGRSSPFNIPTKIFKDSDDLGQAVAWLTTGSGRG